MNDVKQDTSINEFLILKTIEQLYKNNIISENIYKSILNDYSTKVDISQFLYYN